MSQPLTGLRIPLLKNFSVAMIFTVQLELEVNKISGCLVLNPRGYSNNFATNFTFARLVSMIARMDMRRLGSACQVID